MNKLFILLLLFAATNSFGQAINGKTSGMLVDTTKHPESNTALQVVYADKKKAKQRPAFFINGKFMMTESLPNNLGPNRIENIEVIGRDTLINNIQYNGQVYIKTKSDYNYNPKNISLTELKNKYTDLKGKPVICMIDGNIVHADYDNYVIDENNLLTIRIDKFQNTKERIDLDLIILLTKSEENIKKRNQIIIRGTEVAVNN